MSQMKDGEGKVKKQEQHKPCRGCERKAVRTVATVPTVRTVATVPTVPTELCLQVNCSFNGLGMAVTSQMSRKTIGSLISGSPRQQVGGRQDKLTELGV